MWISFTLRLCAAVTIRRNGEAPRRRAPDRETTASRGVQTPGHKRCPSSPALPAVQIGFEIVGKSESAVWPGGQKNGRSEKNKGVGEHVRTKFHLGVSPMKLRITDPHRTKKTCFFYRTTLVGANSSK